MPPPFSAHSTLMYINQSSFFDVCVGKIFQHELFYKCILISQGSLFCPMQCFAFCTGLSVKACGAGYLWGRTSPIICVLRKSGRTAWKRKHPFSAFASTAVALHPFELVEALSSLKKITVWFCATFTISPQTFSKKPEMAFNKLSLLRDVCFN